jgi:hypothetical protein
MRLTLRLLSLASLSAALTLAAHADTFALTNYIFASGATATGTIDINTTTGQVTSMDITYSGLPSEPFNIILGVGATGNYTNAPVDDAAGDVFADSLHTPAGDFIGYTGGPACSDTNTCNPGGIPVTSGIIFSNPNLLSDDLMTGSLTLDPPAPTPEPSSLALFGTGILSLAGIARRRGTRLK